MEQKSHIQKDWEQREITENIIVYIKKIAEFLNKFEKSTSNRLAFLNEKLTVLERQMEYLEASVKSAQTTQKNY
jgi:uncharacterized protein